MAKQKNHAASMLAELDAINRASKKPITQAQIDAGVASLFPKSKPTPSISRGLLSSKPAPRSQGSLSSTPKGTLTERAADWLAGVTGDNRQSRQFADKLATASEFVNPLSWATTLGDSARKFVADPSVGRGVDTALNAANFLPVGKAAGALAHIALPGLKKGALELGEAAARRAATADDFLPHNINNLRNLDDWAILTAENPMGKQGSPKANAKAMKALRDELAAGGHQVIDGVGKYGNHENVLAVLGIPEHKAREVGNKFKQDSVLTNKGLIYHDGRITPAKGVNTFDQAPEDFYTELGNGSKFAMDLDWENEIPAATPDLTADAVLAEAGRKKGAGETFAAWRAKNDAGPGTLFDYSKMDQVPNVPQVPMDRTIPPRGPSDRIQGALADPRVAEGINGYVKRGAELGGKDWYNTEAFRKEYIDRLGPEEGQKAYSEFMDAVAATSPRSTVQDNIRTASYYNYRRQNGLPVNEKPAPGYGSVAQTLHGGNMEKIVNGNGWDIYANPKPASFSTNLQGNQANATIDTHNFRLPGILSQDPRFLETSIAELADSVPAGQDLLRRQYPGLPEEVIQASVKPKGDKATITYRPQKWVNDGHIPMSDAVNDPALWTAKPNANEYGHYEDWQREQAKKLGMSPAQYQASMWVGAGDATGLASPPEPFLRTLESRVKYTADRMKTSPEKVMDALVRGKAPLLSVGAGVGLTGILAGQRPQAQPEDERTYY